MAFRAETPAMHVSSLHPSIPLIQTDTIQPLQYRLETYWCPCLVCYGCGAAIAVLLAACAEKSQNTAQRPQLLHSSGHTRSENNAERPQKMSKKQAEVFFLLLFNSAGSHTMGVEPSCHLPASTILPRIDHG